MDAFVSGGGTVVAWNQGATAAITSLRLPVRNIVAGLQRSEFFTGSSIMQVTVDGAHPVMAGMPETADVMVSGSPVFTTLEGFDGSVIAKYPRHRSALATSAVRSTCRDRPPRSM